MACMREWQSAETGATENACILNSKTNLLLNLIIMSMQMHAFSRYPGSTFIEHLLRLNADPNVKILVLLGEVCCACVY